MTPRLQWSATAPRIWWSTAAFLCISLHFTAFHCISLHFTVFHFIYLHLTAFHCIPLHFSAFLSIFLHFSAFHCISLHFSSFLYISLHFYILYFRIWRSVPSSCGRHFKFQKLEDVLVGQMLISVIRASFEIYVRSVIRNWGILPVAYF